MAAYKCLRVSGQSWAEVLSATPRKTFRFEILGAADDEVRIRNTDGTTTVLTGKGLATTLRAGETQRKDAGLTAGTILAMSRLTPDGTLLEVLTGLEVPAAGPSSLSSFSRPPGEASSIAWLMSEVSEDKEEVAEAPPAAAAPPARQRSAEPGLPSVETLDVGPARTTLIKASGGANRSLMTPLLTIGASMAVGFLTVLVAWRTTDSTEVDKEKARYARPVSIPAPADNVPTPARIALGRRLFSDVGLSANGKIACATCHDPEHAYADGKRASVGVSGKPLRRHSPTLWNVAWGQAFFWDGRSPTLETQALKPLEDPDEMGLTLEDALAKLRADPTYVSAFSSAYPDAPSITGDLLGKALASFQRSLVAPPTRFDRWVAGDRNALSSAEVAGFRVFNGKAGCASCHTGWAFTDHGFHDIGLPTQDKGRGVVMQISRLDHAFKTPSLRELRWTSPYMHDGSMPTLDAVVTHYESGVIERPSLSRDLPRRLNLTSDERAALLAFLGTLSSDATPKPLANIEIARSRGAAASSQASQLKTVGQKDRRFSPEFIRLVTGETLVIVNNDSRPHNVSIAHSRMGFSSGMQDPGEEVKVPFPEAGSYEVFCGVHPNMRLNVEVVAGAIRK